MYIALSVNGKCAEHFFVGMEMCIYVLLMRRCIFKSDICVDMFFMLIWMYFTVKCAINYMCNAL